MNWTGWAEFAGFGSHGLYVWTALGVCALTVLGETLLLRARLRRRLRATADGEHA